MDGIIHTIQTAPLIDLIIVFGLFAGGILGLMQGAVRRIIGILAMLVAFVLAADLRQPVGDYLASNWTQFTSAYDHLFAFAFLFLLFAGAAALATQVFYKRVDIYHKRPVVDDVLGVVLGVVQALLLLTIAIVVFTSYSIPSNEYAAGPDYMRQLHDYMRDAQDLLIRQSTVAGFLRDHVLPGFMHVLSPVLPGEIVSLFP